MKIVDASGLCCPLPLLHLRRGLVSIESGGRVCLISTDKKSLKDVPLFCQQMNHRLVEVLKESDGWRFIVEKSERAV